jgi:CheY-like chemotaxis protein
MDVFIRGMNGIDTTRMIKNYDPSACIVVLTSSLDGDIKREMISLDIDDYLVKPISNAQLIRSLEQSMTRRKGLIR